MDHPEQLIVCAEGGRAEKVLAQQLGLSRRVLIHWLKGGSLRAQGRPLRKGERVEAGQSLTLNLAGPIGAWVPPAPLPLPLLARGDGWLAIDKPAGMPSHLAWPFEANCGLNHLTAHAPSAANCGDDPLQGGLVHRLDNEASGVLLAANTPASWQRLRQAFSRQKVHRIYRARVTATGGDLPKGSGSLRLGLRARGSRVVVDPSGGRPTVTRWRSIDAFGLLEVEILTGHRHQIRVALANSGWPIIGDTLYGGPPAARTLLHAHRLGFEGQWVEASLPRGLEPGPLPAP